MSKKKYVNVFGNERFYKSFLKTSFRKESTKHNNISGFIFFENENRKRDLKKIANTT